MGFNCGIVGLPNVGKSTLFNALTQSQAAEAANFPFTTIEPNVGRVAVPDGRLDAIGDIVKPQRVVPTQLEFVDIAGLVKGASKGEGLGNQFLGQIREVDAICHVLRCFDEGGVAHVTGAPDPVGDADTVTTELMLADMESLSRRSEALVKKTRGGDKAAVELKLAEQALSLLEEGKPARLLEASADDAKVFKGLGLLTAKPVLYVLNVDEDAADVGNDLSAKAAAMAEAGGGDHHHHGKTNGRANLVGGVDEAGSQTGFLRLGACHARHGGRDIGQGHAQRRQQGGRQNVDHKGTIERQVGEQDEGRPHQQQAKDEIGLGAEPADQPAGEANHDDHDQNGHRQERKATDECGETEDLLQIEVEEEPQRDPGRAQKGHDQIAGGEVGRLEDTER